MLSSKKIAQCVILRFFSVGVVALGLTTLSSGCAVKGGSDGSFLKSGSLGLSRPAPLAPKGRATDSSSLASKDIRASLSPSALNNSELSSEASSAIVISRGDRTITANIPGNDPLVISAEGAQRLAPGSYTITMKEERPLWYAPREYFVNRSLKVPNEGSRERFRRAALGNRAIYLNNQAPIHSGPVWLSEIGGLRLDHRKMEQLYSMVPVGTRVEVR